LHSDILARDGLSAQLLHGWYEPSQEDCIWSTQQAAAVLKPRPGSHSIHVSGLLPPGLAQSQNELTINCEGREVGCVINPWDETIPFGLDFEIPEDAGRPWYIEFRTRHMLRPRERGLGSDARDLGFALVLLTSNRSMDCGQERKQALELAPLRRWVERVDRTGVRLRQGLGAPFRRHCAPVTRPGVSVVIPERDNVTEFSACLRSVRLAADRTAEPTEIIAVVNGANPAAYEELRRSHPRCRWLFFEQPLGFGEAAHRGLRAARFDWVYLLNSDATLDESAIETLLPLRAADVFAVGSQIFLKDSTRYREETNLCVFLIENGLATVHDRIPKGSGIEDSFYAGGGASLFQREALLPLAAASSAYAPFYWEDVEWGWRARKQGYRVLFCPASVVHHRQRATIAKYYEADAIEAVIERNRLLFQLRNLTCADSIDRHFEEMARSPAATVRHLLRGSVMWSSLRVRLWNHLAQRDDGQMLRDAEAMRA
jgi:GT2 family glycosyltransferase